jgi:hypothetical protein
MQLQTPLNFENDFSNFRKSWDFQILDEKLYADFKPAGNTLYFNENIYYFKVDSKQNHGFISFEINEVSPSLGLRVISSTSVKMGANM